MYRKIVGIALLLGIVGVAAFNALNLWEAYGNGPPYYGGTTNMDKWESPWPILAPVDGVTVVVAAIYIMGARRRRV
ncbi:hypothetical protein UCD39_05000 [Nitrospirillum sp. BR 11752]|uniref:hypothetical protein n=1 Tax=Nitrospirillum sp. BR 11752 TaxID=3104293 RepID=UPI002EBA3DF8|nr:hypothetical protein [Nitrospirillum sp. BR 11752]